MFTPAPLFLRRELPRLQSQLIQANVLKDLLSYYIDLLFIITYYCMINTSLYNWESNNVIIVIYYAMNISS